MNGNKNNKNHTKKSRSSNHKNNGKAVIQLNTASKEMVEVVVTGQRKSWSRERKIEVVNYAQQFNTYQAALKFGVNRKSIREWSVNY